MKQVLQAMNIPIYQCQGWEADDVIGTVGRICSNNGWECVVVTGDRDSLQLIDENVHIKLVISKPGQTTATLYTREKFEEEYGFEPKKLIDLKALMGDSSDNIPGVAGVGPKTATDLLAKFGSLDGVYQNLEDSSIKPKLREKLENGRENAYLSYELATIVPEAPIEFEPKDALIMPYNKPDLYALFQKLEFVRLIDKYGLRGAAVEAAAAAPTKKTQKLPRVDAMPEDVSSCAAYLAEDGSLGLAWESGVCVLTPMEVQMGVFDLSRKNLLLHDSKTAMHRMDEIGLSYGPCVFDTALAAYDLNPSQSEYPVSKLATNFLGISVEDGDAAGCAEAIWNLCEPLTEELEKNGMTKLYFDMELPLCSVLYRMEKEGIDIDETQLQQFGEMLAQRITDCEKVIYAYSDGPFNINSTKQLGELLFEKLELPVINKTKTGYSTNADVLEKLQSKHPIVPAIMDYRMLTKLKLPKKRFMRASVPA
jgi:DNA polymerase-1